MIENMRRLSHDTIVERKYKQEMKTKVARLSRLIVLLAVGLDFLLIDRLNGSAIVCSID